MLHTFFLPISYCVKLFVPLDLPHIQFSLPSKEEIYHLQFLPTKIMSSASLRATPKSFCDETVLHFWPLPPCGESEVSVHTSQWCVLFFPPFFPPSLLPTPSLFFLSFILSFPKSHRALSGRLDVKTQSKQYNFLHIVDAHPVVILVY